MKKHNYYILFSGLIITLLSTSIAKSQDILWEKSFGGKQAEYLLDAIPTPDYGFILAGSSLSDKSGNKEAERKGNYDYCLWKISENGNIDWQKSFGGSNNDMLMSTQATKDGGYILAGTSDSPMNFDKTDATIGQQDLWIIRLDAGGNPLWQKTIGGLAEEQLGCIVQTSDGGYIIGASSASDKYLSKKSESNKNTLYKDSNSRGNLDYWVIKLDKKGELEWQKTMGGAPRSRANPFPAPARILSRGTNIKEFIMKTKT